MNRDRSSPGAASPVLVVVSDVDPVAVGVAELWGTPPATGFHVQGAVLRQLDDGMLLLRRPGPHIHDELLDLLLPSELLAAGPTLVFPSIHRSEQNVPCLTVHPLGNPGSRAEVGGRPKTLVPTDPPRMSAALRALRTRGEVHGWAATFEATHHGPELKVPAFFVEIGYGTLPAPPIEAVRILADEIPRLRTESGERVALAVGGGHYGPHFTDLVVRRRWAFGHILSRHALAELDAPTAAAAFRETPGAEGIVYARAQDAELGSVRELGPRLRDADAPPRTAVAEVGPSPGGSASSGT